MSLRPQAQWIASLLFLVALLGAPVAGAATTNKVTIEDVKVKDVRNLQSMGADGYFLVLEGRAQGWQTEHTLMTWDLDLRPMGQSTIALPSGATLSRGVFDGEQLYLTTIDTTLQEVQVHSFTTDAKPAGVLTIPSGLKLPWQQYLTAVAAPIPGEGVSLVMFDSHERKFACTTRLIGRDLQVQWTQPVFHPQGTTFCSSVVHVGDGMAVQHTKRLLAKRHGGYQKLLSFVDQKTGDTVSSHRLDTDEYTLTPTTIYTTDQELFVAGESRRPKRSETHPPDGFFVSRLRHDGSFAYTMRADWDDDTRKKFQGGNEDTYDNLIGYRSGILVHEILADGAHDLVLAELVQKKAGGKGTTLSGKPMKTRYTFGDYLLIRIERESGNLVDLQLIPKGDHAIDLPPAYADQLGFAEVARQQGWSGFLFSESGGNDGSMRVVSWSNAGDQRSLDTLTIGADGSLRTGQIPLDAMQRRDRTAIFRSSSGHVVLVQYTAKEKRLTLEQIAID
ncbi:MAG TPA: hypothetical protein DFR83_07090 [Deltaproteobacteria bacterium]|nr:hypothetical protein [Deltaproteobacteria bacterium]